MVSSVRARLLRRLGIPRAAARRALRRAGDDIAAALRLARDALAAPAVSTACTCIFSLAG